MVLRDPKEVVVSSFFFAAPLMGLANDLSSDQSNTVVFALPIEVLKAE